jgi:hypothetical protein
VLAGLDALGLQEAAEQRYRVVDPGGDGIAYALLGAAFGHPASVPVAKKQAHGHPGSRVVGQQADQVDVLGEEEHCVDRDADLALGAGELSTGAATTRVAAACPPTIRLPSRSPWCRSRLSGRFLQPGAAVAAAGRTGRPSTVRRTSSPVAK